MDEVQLTLPISKKVVIIRGYTTQADDELAEELMYDGIDAQTDEGGNQKFSISMNKIMASKKVYVNRLVRSIDGNTTDVPQQLADLRSKDYKAVKEAVEKIVDEHSPKDQEAISASNSSTTKK